jgi:hypothetical protein
MAKKKTKTNKEGGFVKVPIKYNIPDTITTKFVTNSTVQIMEEEFKISFFEMKPKLSFDKKDKLPSDIQVDCVAAVVMTPNRISRLIGALQKQLDTYNSSIK